MNIKNIIAAVALLLLGMEIFAQHNVNSPYTMFGIGYIETGGFGRNKAMGGAGISLPSEYSLNNLNPASYSSIDSLHFFLETGINAIYSKFAYRSQTQKKLNANFSYLALGFRMNRRWATSIGLAPYSNIGYNIDTWKQIEGTSYYSQVNIDGSGGLNQFYWGNSYKLNRNFSVGINASYLFGSISQVQKTTNSFMSGEMTVENESTLRNFYFNYGVQYHYTLNSNIKGSFGAVYGSKTKLNFNNTLTIMDFDADTLSSGLKRKSDFYIPQTFGFGASLRLKDKLLLTGDYTQNNWSGINTTETGVKMVNSSNVAFGIEYLPSVRVSANYLQSVKYRLGFYNENSYLKINGQQLKDYGFTAGFGFPVKKSKAFINVAFAAGLKGNTNSSSIINETYYKVNLNFTLLDYWFNRMKYD
jgi:long-subunit fatty acid transport protein